MEHVAEEWSQARLTEGNLR